MNNSNRLNKLVPLLVFILSLSFLSCNKLKEQPKTIIEEWYKKEILFPKKLMIKCLGHDTTNSYILNHQYKIVVYIDSMGCTPCKLQLYQWKEFIDSSHLKRYDVSFLFIVQSTNYKGLEEELYISRFTYPIIYDPNDEFNKLNRFPKEDKYRTFLLDDKNRIVLIGSPIRNDNVKKLYVHILGCEKETNIKQSKDVSITSLPAKTTLVKLTNDSINLGKFSFQASKQIPFKLINQGKQPLIILNVNTSCGCMVAKYDKKPIAKGESTTVVLDFKPNSLGYFSKTADVMCNVPNGFVRLKISGEVVEK